MHNIDIKIEGSIIDEINLKIPWKSLQNDV